MSLLLEARCQEEASPPDPRLLCCGAKVQVERPGEALTGG